MDDSRQRAIDNLERLLGAVDELQAGLKVTKSQYRRALRALRQGESVRSALVAAGSAQTREFTTVMLEDFERARHVSRLALIEAGVDEGMSINAISRAWGVSRQLASRYVNQVRGGEGQETKGQATKGQTTRGT
jgi:hypothetical protein